MSDRRQARGRLIAPSSESRPCPPAGLRLALLAALGAGFALVTVLAAGPLWQVDRALAVPWVQRGPELRPAFEILVRLGQRAVCLPLLLAVAVLTARRLRTWRPVLVAAVAVLALNLLVGAAKIATARAIPLSGDTAFFEGGLAYPSGHAANAVLVYGLAAVLAGRAWGPRSVIALALAGLTVAASLAMVLTGLYFRWHWFSDLMAGLLLGGFVLQAAVVLGHPRGSRERSA